MTDLEQRTIELMEQYFRDTKDDILSVFVIPPEEPFDLTEEESQRLLEEALLLAEKCVAGNAPEDELIAGLMYLMMCQNAYSMRLDYKQMQENLDLYGYLKPKYWDVPID